MSKKLKWIIPAVVVILMLLYVTPYYVLVMRQNIWAEDWVMTDAQVNEQWTFPVRCNVGYSIMSTDMRRYYGWFHELDAKLRYEYWHATSPADLRENHKFIGGRTWQ